MPYGIRHFSMTLEPATLLQGLSCFKAPKSVLGKVTMMKKNSPRSNIAPFVHPAIASELAEFKNRKTVDAFLALMTKAVQIGSPCLCVFDSWRKHCAVVDLSGSWEKVAKWLSRLDLRQGEKEHDAAERPLPSEPYRPSDPVRAAVSALFKEMADEQRRREVQMKTAGVDYDNFVGAWPFADELKKYPSIERSAQFINRFLRQMFSAKTERPPQKIVVRAEIEPFINFLVTEFLEAVFKAEHRAIRESTDTRHEILAAIQGELPSVLMILLGKFRLTQEDDYPRGFYLSVLVLLLDYMPKDLKARLLVQITHDCCDELEGEYDYPSATEPIRHLLVPILNSPDTPTEAIAAYLTALRCSGATKSIGTSVVSESLAQLSERLRTWRREQGGVSLVFPDEAADFCQEIGRIAFWNHTNDLQSLDLAILMAPCDYPWVENVNLFNYDGLPPEDCYDRVSDDDGDTPGEDGLPPEDCYDLVDGGRTRSEWYLRVWREAINEGYVELANSCLAFFLFSQPQLCEGRLHSDWRALTEMFQASCGMPGERAVRDAAGIALGIIREKGYGNGLDALNLEGWASDTAIEPANVEQLLHGIAVHRSAEAALQKAIGQEAWVKLSTGAKFSLLTAEKSWMAISSEVGFGTSDVGQIAVGYVKAIELELTSRCNFLLTSSTYHAYCQDKFGRSANPYLTLGSVINVLRDYPKLSEGFQQEIEATGMTLQHDSGLVKRLLGWTNLRNDGAHSDHVGDEKLIKLRTDLFKNGVFKRFVESLGCTAR